MAKQLPSSNSPIPVKASFFDQDVDSTTGAPTKTISRVWLGFFQNLISTIQSLIASAITFPITVPQGGTGAVSFFNHGPLMGEGAGQIVAATPGNLGQPFLSGSASADGAYGSLETIPAALGTDYTVTLSPAAIGLSVTLDQVGTYVITVDLGIDIDQLFAVFGYLYCGAAIQSGFIKAGVTTLGATDSIALAESPSKHWVFLNTVIGTVASVQANGAGTGSATIKATNSTILADFRG